MLTKAMLVCLRKWCQSDVWTDNESLERILDLNFFFLIFMPMRADNEITVCYVRKANDLGSKERYKGF